LLNIKCPQVNKPKVRQQWQGTKTPSGDRLGKKTHLYAFVRFVKPQWHVSLRAGSGLGHSYKFIRIMQLLKKVRLSKNLG